MGATLFYIRSGKRLSLGVLESYWAVLGFVGLFLDMHIIS